MYTRLKSIIHRIIPVKYLSAPRSIARRLLYLKYRGTNYTCNICDAHLKSFIDLENGERICPLCGSSARNRRVYAMVGNENIAGKKILEFSPNAALRMAMKFRLGSHYVCSDWEDEFKADKKLNITDINEPDSIYDLIILFHVLEHISDDKKAMSELYRILKPGGQIWIQTPFREGDIYEDECITDPMERLKHFGQEDHVRIYSVSGLRQRLEQTGFKIVIKRYSEKNNNLHGLLQTETVLLAGK